MRSSFACIILFICPINVMLDVLLLPASHPPFFFLSLMKKQRHRDIMQLAEVIEPELEVRLFDFRVIIPHGVSCVRKIC